MVNTLPPDIFNSSAIFRNFNLQSVKTSLWRFLTFSRKTAKSFVSGRLHLKSAYQPFMPHVSDAELTSHGICGMNWWPSGKVSASAYFGCWFDLQWWRSRCALLMRPNKVETDVQCSICHM